MVAVVAASQVAVPVWAQDEDAMEVMPYPFIAGAQVPSMVQTPAVIPVPREKPRDVPFLVPEVGDEVVAEDVLSEVEEASDVVEGVVSENAASVLDMALVETQESESETVEEVLAEVEEPSESDAVSEMLLELEAAQQDVKVSEAVDDDSVLSEDVVVEEEDEALQGVSPGDEAITPQELEALIRSAIYKDPTADEDADNDVDVSAADDAIVENDETADVEADVPVTEDVMMDNGAEDLVEGVDAASVEELDEAVSKDIEAAVSKTDDDGDALPDDALEPELEAVSDDETDADETFAEALELELPEEPDPMQQLEREMGEALRDAGAGFELGPQPEPESRDVSSAHENTEDGSLFSLPAVKRFFGVDGEESSFVEALEIENDVAQHETDVEGDSLDVSDEGLELDAEPDALLGEDAMPEVPPEEVASDDILEAVDDDVVVVDEENSALEEFDQELEKIHQELVQEPEVLDVSPAEMDAQAFIPVPVQKPAAPVVTVVEDDSVEVVVEDAPVQEDVVVSVEDADDAVAVDDAQLQDTFQAMDADAQTRRILSVLPPRLEVVKPRPVPPSVAIDHADPTVGIFQDGQMTSGADVNLSVSDRDYTPTVTDTLELAYQAVVAGQHESAIALYKAILDQNASNSYALFGLATTYHKNRQLAQARDMYEAVLTQYPEHTDALNNFLVLLGEERPEVALKELTSLNRRNPDFAPVEAQLGMTHHRMGNSAQAAAHLGKAVRLAPDNLSYRLNLAVVLDSLGEYRKAAEFYQSVVDAAYEGQTIPGNLPDIQKRLTFIRAQ